jgi:cytochrome P450
MSLARRATRGRAKVPPLGERHQNSVDYNPETDPKEKLDKGVQARKDLRQRLGELVEQRHGRPGDDLLSGLANDDGPDGRMADAEIVATAKLLLIAGHKTIVNLITNGMLTVLRHPQVLQRLRDEPDLVVPLVEELLCYEPPFTSFPGGRRTATSPSPTPSSPRARRSCSCWPRAAAIRSASTIRTVSTRIGVTTSTSASAAASTCASTARQPGGRPRSR